MGSVNETIVHFVQHFLFLLNGHTTSNRRPFDVDITSIRRRPNFDEFLRHFRVLSRCSFHGQKIHVVSTYFYRCNSDGRKTYVVSTYFFGCNCLVEICTLFLSTFFNVILIGKKLTWFLVSCKLMKTFEKFFPVLVTLNSWLLQDCSI